MEYSLAAYNQLVQYGNSWSGQCPAYGFFRGEGPMGAFFGGHLMTVIIAVLLVAALYLVFRNAGHARSAGSPSESPLDIIKARYARGEITRDQYEAMRNDLKG